MFIKIQRMYTEDIYEHILPLDKSLNPEGWVPPFATRYYFFFSAIFAINVYGLPILTDCLSNGI